MEKESLKIAPAKEGVVICIKVVLKSSRNQIAGWENGVLKVKLNAVPEKGEANRILIAFLADIWDLPKSSLELISGLTSRQKKILVKGMDVEKMINKMRSTAVGLKS